MSEFIQKENRSEWKINLSKACERVKKRDLKKMKRGRGRTQLSKWILIDQKLQFVNKRQGKKQELRIGRMAPSMPCRTLECLPLLISRCHLESTKRESPPWGGIEKNRGGEKIEEEKEFLK